MFAQKYPASAAVIALFAMAVNDVAASLQPGETLLEKLASFGNLVPGIVGFIPQAGKIADEVKSFTVGDDISAIEMLVTDLKFSNEKAQAVIVAAFPVLEDLAALSPKVVTLVEAIKA